MCRTKPHGPPCVKQRYGEAGKHGDSLTTVAGKTETGTRKTQAEGQLTTLPHTPDVRTPSVKFTPDPDTNASKRRNRQVLCSRDRIHTLHPNARTSLSGETEHVFVKVKDDAIKPDGATGRAGI